MDLARVNFGAFSGAAWLLTIAFSSGCASTETSPAPEAAPASSTKSPVVVEKPAPTPTPSPRTQSPQSQAPRPPVSVAAVETMPAGPPGTLQFDIADIAGRPLPARIEIRNAQDQRFEIVQALSGKASIDMPSGLWKSYVYVIDGGAPILVDIHEVDVPPGGAATVTSRILEGAGGNRPLRAFDGDMDLALDRVELQVGTDPQDAASVPGLTPINWPSPVLSPKAQWYRGELHAHSKYGIGSESVGELVRRAERTGLDFLAIADRNTLQASFDPEFRSSSMVLIPAMEWGNDELGVALVYAPRTALESTSDIGYAQAMAYRVQSQGGLFMVAHPCFATAPWQWGLSYVNGIEAWCRGWRSVPPLWMDRLTDNVKVRKDGELIHSIALATATPGYSANGQGAWFYDNELNRGLKAAVIGGSYSVGPQVPLGQPVTYVFANEKSLKGLLDGIRWGRTFVSKGLDGPKLGFVADILNDGTIESGVGGWVPLNVPVLFRVEVQNAPDATVEILLNGSVFRSFKSRNNGNFAYEFAFVAESYSVFRARVIAPAQGEGYGVNEVLAMTSPIYALEVVPEIPGAEDNIWLAIEHNLFNPGPNDRFVPGNPATDEYRTIQPKFRF